MGRAALLVIALAWARPAAAQTIVRTVPTDCPAGAQATAANSERAWNLHYRTAWEALEQGDVEAAHASICAALHAAARFSARDWRFAEALDELGLIEYLRGDDERSVAAQAGAVAEMLLAKGPRSPEVALYAARLAWPLQRSGADRLAAAVTEAPYRVFTDDLVRVDRAQAARLDWLVSEYLALEDLGAARALERVIRSASEPR